MASDNLVRIAPNNPVFDLPVLVGIEEGLFADVGLDVNFVATYDDREKDNVEQAYLNRLKESMFEKGDADSYNVCEWATIDRVERGKGGGHIAALRAAVGAQAILTFDDKLQTPRDMVDVPVAVQEYTGSHFTTLQMLESAVGLDHVNIFQARLPQMRYAGLKSGEYRAATVMEPYISLGLKEGAHMIASSFYRGGEVVGPNLTAEQRESYYEAENKAVDMINADFYKYSHYMTDRTNGGLEPSELLRAFVHYKHVDFYGEDLFNHAYDWMKDRNFTNGMSPHDAIVFS
jgi:NitT/TauT family transport system substrate-binding protein